MVFRIHSERLCLPAFAAAAIAFRSLPVIPARSGPWLPLLAWSSYSLHFALVAQGFLNAASKQIHNLWIGARQVGRKRVLTAVWWHELRDGRCGSPRHPTTREVACEEIKAALLENVEERRRVLIGFDFPYGYPSGMGTDSVRNTMEGYL